MKPGCYFFRDADGFCHLGRCWEGKACPKDADQAERFRQQEIAEAIAAREESDKAMVEAWNEQMNKGPREP